jgi:pimeloyl-ACP methyl ester carboxylesterase
MLVPYPPDEPKDPSDTRTPLILVHGIHGAEDWDKNGKLDELEAVEQLAGWQRFIEYFDSNSELNSKYKIFRFLYLSDLQPVTEIGRSFRMHLDRAISRGDMNDLPVVLLAHSMGGLVSRSLMQKYEGTAKIKKLITLATPHHGSPGANDTNALRKLFTGGPRGAWHFLLAEFQLLYNLVSVADGSRWDVMMNSDHPNRSDLRWDNKGGSVLVGASDANGWLAGLNDSLKKNMAQKIITYYGYVDYQTECRKSWSSPWKIHLKTNLMPLFNEHKQLCIAGAIMDAGMNYVFQANDGMVPIQSARLHGHKVAKRVSCADHDHLDMLEDPEKECSTKKRLFESLKDDLLDIAQSP